MANKTNLKTYFETGNIPKQSQYADLIESNLNLQETGTQILVGTLSSSNLLANKFQAYNSGFSGSYLKHHKLTIHESDSNLEAFSVEASINKASLVIRLNNAPRVYIDPINDSYIYTNGNFGIGDSTPSYKLDVAGTGRFTSALSVGGTLLVGSNITTSGNSSFGSLHQDGNIDTHTFTGHITASGNISSSGTLTCNTLKVDGSQIDFTNLPEGDPNVPGRLYIEDKFIKISQ